LARYLRKKFKAKFSKPYTIDYRRSPYYKQSFRLKLYHKLNKYNLKYDNTTNKLLNVDTNEPFLIFSFDESSQQFTSNNVRVWSLNKPKMFKNGYKVKVNAAGAYSLTHEGHDYLEFMEDSTAVSISKVLQNLRNENHIGVILILIDNFPSHKAHLVKDIAIQLNIDLLFLPPYSPQLQPEEKIWHSTKRDISQFKADTIPNLNELNQDKTKELLENVLTKSFYHHTKSKERWNTVKNEYILPLIKKLNPLENQNWKLQKTK